MIVSRWTTVLLTVALGLCLGCGSRDPDRLMEQGVRAYERGRYRTAARAFGRAIQLEPRNPAARLWCGVALWKTGSDDRAIPHFLEAAALDPANPLPLEYAALAHARRGEWLETAKRLNEAFRRMPDSPRILNAMGVASFLRGSPSASLAQLMQALRVSPQYAPALFNAARLNRDSLDQPAEARVLFQRYLELAPDGERAEEARKALEALDPGGPASLPASDAARGSARSAERSAELMRQARAAVQRRDYDEAAIRFQEAGEAAPGEPDPLWELARVFDGPAAQPVRALELYRAFIRAFSDDARAVDARVRVNTLAARRTTRAPSPPSPPASAEGDELAFRKPDVRNRAEALQALRRGAQYYARQDWDRAQFDFKRAIELDDSLPEGYFNLGLVYWMRQEYGHARQLFQNALAKKSDWPDARCMLARVYLRQQLGLKAVEHFNEILKTAPDYADAYYELGSYHSGTASRKPQVRSWYSRYLELAPRGPHAAQVSAWLAANP